MSEYIWKLTQKELHHKMNFAYEQGIANERERIVAILEERKARWDGDNILDDYPQGYWDALEESIALIKGENE